MLTEPQQQAVYQVGVGSGFCSDHVMDIVSSVEHDVFVEGALGQERVGHHFLLRAVGACLCVVMVLVTVPCSEAIGVAGHTGGGGCMGWVMPVCVEFDAVDVEHTVPGLVKEVTELVLCGACFWAEGSVGGLVVGVSILEEQSMGRFASLEHFPFLGMLGECVFVYVAPHFHPTPIKEGDWVSLAVYCPSVKEGGGGWLWPSVASLSTLLLVSVQWLRSLCSVLLSSSSF